jgi:sulfatase maturation enzyme AslB (radical SAM superfamily)
MRYVLSCGNDYLVLMPKEGLLFRTNAEAARRFQQMEQDTVASDEPPSRSPLPPTQVTVITSLECPMRCLYCPVRIERSSLRMDPAFCAAACRLVVANANLRNVKPRVVFHGMGEPTFDWHCFRGCVDSALNAAAAVGSTPHLTVCTAGQLEESQARFICEHFNTVYVSLDGPLDLQMLYRQRKDGGNSFDPALRTARLSADSGCRTVINVTVTDATVGRMADVVKFVGEEIGRVVICFESVFVIPSMRGKIRAPQPSTFLEGFSKALDVADRLSVVVTHSTVSLDSIAAEPDEEMSPMILFPDGTVRERIEFGHDGKVLSQAGVCGTYDAEARAIKFSPDEKVSRIQEASRGGCELCACFRSCHGGSLIRTSFPSVDGGVQCEINRGVLTMLLDRATRRFAYQSPLLSEEKCQQQQVTS